MAAGGPRRRRGLGRRRGPGAGRRPGAGRAPLAGGRRGGHQQPVQRRRVRGGRRPAGGARACWRVWAATTARRGPWKRRASRSATSPPPRGRASTWTRRSTSRSCASPPVSPALGAWTRRWRRSSRASSCPAAVRSPSPGWRRSSRCSAAGTGSSSSPAAFRPASLAYLEEQAACRVRAFVEERGMRAAPANRPRSILADWVTERGPASLVERLTDLGGAVILDSRVVMAALVGSSDSRPVARARGAVRLRLRRSHAASKPAGCGSSPPQPQPHRSRSCSALTPWSATACASSPTPPG